MRHYCTVADSRYLPQLLAMHKSLRDHSSVDIMLDVLALDEACAKTLESMKLYDVSVDLNLFRPKAGQTWQEFCWSCASQYSDYLLNSLFSQAGMPDLTYLDADLFFFSDPERVFREIGKRSIAITPHRLIPSKKHLEVNGKYNVGWVTFRNTDAGRECLSQWAAQVRDKCSATEGCGDQLYLDSWPDKYGAEVCELGIGVNVAPWNLANWSLGILSNERLGIKWPCVSGVPIVCYHFHEYRHGERLTNYELRQEDRDLIYAPYIDAVNKATERVAGTKMELQWETA